MAKEPLRFQEELGVAFVEPEFFEIFDFPWISGISSSLKNEFTVALAESQALKYFGTTDVIGKTLRLDNQYHFQIVGVVRDFPKNTDFPFTLLMSWKSLKKMDQPVTHWNNTWTSLNTFILLNDEFTKDRFLSLIPEFIKKNIDERQAKGMGYALQPLSLLHFESEYGNFPQRMASPRQLWALGLIGLFLVVTACINFINLATALAVQRSKEVGVRKVLGARRSQLIFQFLSETTIIAVIAMIISIGLVELALPYVNSFFSASLVLDLLNPRIILFIVCTVAVVSLGSGLYPGIILSRFLPVTALKGRQMSGSVGGFLLRKGLVTLQFIISQFLIVSTIVILSQMQRFQSENLGYDPQAVTTVPLPLNDKIKLEALRHNLIQNPSIKSVSFAWTSASANKNWGTITRFVKGNEILEINSNMKIADENFVPLYGFNLLAGRNIRASDSTNEFVINETMVQKLGFQNPQDAIGQIILYGSTDTPIPIVGVVRDFVSLTLRRAMQPTIIASERNWYSEANIKIEMANATQVLSQIEKAWTEAFPEFVYSYEFLDERIAGFYSQERRMMILFEVFSGIAVLIACLGLFGLVAFLAAQKTKEIGIRKVLGASVANVLMIFGAEFLKLVLVAFLFSAPLAYFLMDRWLADFAYRIDLGPGIFAIALSLTLLLVAITVGYRALRAATANPVDSLKCE